MTTENTNTPGVLNLNNKRFLITGLQGSGKSNLAKHLLRQTPQHFVYDPLNEYQGFNRYVPGKRNSIAEFEKVTEFVIATKPRFYLVDEANKYILPKPHPLPEKLGDLNDFSRHWGISWALLARRPSQFHTDVVELAHYLFVFRTQGRNDRKFLDDIHKGLGDIATTLPPFHFLVIDGANFYVHSPVLKENAPEIPNTG